MPTTQQLRTRLANKLKELFQLDQPDLDFGFYRIMHAKAEQVTAFIENDLLKIVADAFGHLEVQNSQGLLTQAKQRVIDTLGEDAFDAEGNLVAAYRNSPIGKGYLAELAKLEQSKSALSAEADIYDHLYRFFERYYDAGDFISRRYYARETAGKAAPFAIPYNGEEVKLHWANADQYYIKTTEYFANFTFDLRQAAEVRDQRLPLNFGEDKSPLVVHFRVVDATEGEHGNVKTSEANKRFFIIHADNPVERTVTGELVCNFEYRADPEKTGKDDTWRDKRNSEAVELILDMLRLMAKDDQAINEYLILFRTLAPTAEEKNRSLLAKYINQYTARNTMDYFVHKDLGGFLRRELDFYIKNEVMRLDDIENAEVPAVETYLTKIKVLRKIANKLIAFLTQLEEFQKKLWLKKKFVVETNYCITLDRVPVEFYTEIAANDAQREEWVRLFAIDEIKESTIGPGYSVPLTVGFLTSNPFLVVDTCFFKNNFCEQIIASINMSADDINPYFDSMIHSENLQALHLLRSHLASNVSFIYLDPPYNTGNDGFIYKDNYRHSSWMTLMADRLSLAYDCLRPDGCIAVSIDQEELSALRILMDTIFGRENLISTITVKRASVTGHKTINPGVVNISEFVLLYAKDRKIWTGNEIYSERERDQRYSSFIINRHKHYSEWRFTTVLDELSQRQGVQKSELRRSLGEEYESVLEKFVYDHASAVMQLATVSIDDVGINFKQAVVESKRKPEDVFRFQRDGLSDVYLLAGKKILFYEDKLIKLGERLVTAEKASDIWLDVLPNDIHNEGGVNLRKGKKPETLISRLIELGSDEGDIVLDFFAGSATTMATAKKMNRAWIGVESADYFDSISITRLKYVLNGESRGVSGQYSWNGGGMFKYLRLESYEDTLNNLRFEENTARRQTIASNATLKADYILHYLLDVETRGSQSLLNIDAIADPTAYTLQVKKPGTDEYVEKTIDLLETFNYLIGLRVHHIAAPQTFNADFERLPDPELPHDQHTKLGVNGRIRQDADGPWWFRKVEGWVPQDPNNPNNGQQEKVLIVWRKLTGDQEKDNLMLDEWFQRNRISPRDFEFDTIYVNGSNNLPNLKQDGDNWKVRLLEEEFMQRMWDVEGM